MPDIVAHGQEGIKRWENEKCVSCKRPDDKCPLITAMLKHRIESFAGFYVYTCALYLADTYHPLYIETQAEKNLVDYETQMDRLRNLHARSNNQPTG